MPQRRTGARTFWREDVLAAPAHSVRELEGGWIELIACEDPLAYETPPE